MRQYSSGIHLRSRDWSFECDYIFQSSSKVTNNKYYKVLINDRRRICWQYISYKKIREYKQILANFSMDQLYKGPRFFKSNLFHSSKLKEQLSFSDSLLSVVCQTAVRLSVNHLHVYFNLLHLNH